MTGAIGIFGGTFDPIHFGHLRPAVELLERLNLSELRFIPSRQPPHRGQPSATPEQRLAMLRLAVADQPGFCVDERELRREGPSYTVDTLREIRAEVGETVPLLLIVGLDAFLGLATWHEWQSLNALAHIVVAHRPGWTLEDSSASASEPVLALLEQARLERPEQLLERPSAGVWLEPVTQLAISATNIRALIAQNRSVRYLVPEPVRLYIESSGLYR